jgi:hypothetical protein
MARWFAKKRYLWTQECEAATADLHAGLSLKLAAEKRAEIAQLNKEADDIETNIKAVDEKLAQGYWECENGHERSVTCRCASPSGLGTAIVHTHGCPLSEDVTVDGKPVGAPASPIRCDCGKPMRFISASTMTGQEKYESDKERKEAEAMAENKRAQAKAEEENVKGSEQTAKYFRDQAKNNRSISQKVRTL